MAARQNGGTGGAGQRPGLARQQRFIDMRVTRNNLAVRGKGFSWQHPNQIARLQMTHGHSLAMAVWQFTLHAVGQSLHQLAERARCAVTQTLLQPAAGKQKEDKHRQRVKVNLMAPPALRRKGCRAADSKGDDDAQRHRQIHADAALAQVTQCVAEKRCAGKKNYRQAEQH